MPTEAQQKMVDASGQSAVLLQRDYDWCAGVHICKINKGIKINITKMGFELQ